MGGPRKFISELRRLREVRFGSQRGFESAKGVWVAEGYLGQRRLFGSVGGFDQPENTGMARGLRQWIRGGGGRVSFWARVGGG